MVIFINIQSLTSFTDEKHFLSFISSLTDIPSITANTISNPIISTYIFQVSVPYYLVRELNVFYAYLKLYIRDEIMEKSKFKQGFLTELYPLLAIQFDERKNQQNVKDIHISSFYDDKIFHWRCPNCDCERETSLYSRLKNDVAWRQLKCGQCIKGLSFAELAIRIHFERIILQVFPNAIVTSGIYKGFEIDIIVIIPNISKIFGIEYDSEFYHKNRIDFDKLKNSNLIKEYFLIRFREEGLSSLNDSSVKEIASPRYPKENLCEFDCAIRRSFQYFNDFLVEHLPVKQNELKKVKKK